LLIAYCNSDTLLKLTTDYQKNKNIIETKISDLMHICEKKAASTCTYNDWEDGIAPHKIKKMNAGRIVIRGLVGNKVETPCEGGERVVMKFKKQRISCKGDTFRAGDGLTQLSVSSAEKEIFNSCKESAGTDDGIFKDITCNADYGSYVSMVALLDHIASTNEAGCVNVNGVKIHSGYGPCNTCTSKSGKDIPTTVPVEPPVPPTPAPESKPVPTPNPAPNPTPGLTCNQTDIPANVIQSRRGVRPLNWGTPESSMEFYVGNDILSLPFNTTTKESMETRLSFATFVDPNQNIKIWISECPGGDMIQAGLACASHGNESVNMRFTQASDFTNLGPAWKLGCKLDLNKTYYLNMQVDTCTSSECVMGRLEMKYN
jgi:hypothetical protein